MDKYVIPAVADEMIRAYLASQHVRIGEEIFCPARREKKRFAALHGEKLRGGPGGTSAVKACVGKC